MDQDWKYHTEHKTTKLERLFDDLKLHGPAGNSARLLIETRDEFAKAAMAGFCSSGRYEQPRMLAAMAYEVADAMLAEREF